MNIKFENEFQKCLRRDPNKRPTTTELLNHSYLIDSKPTKANDYQNALISQINDLTPNRIKQLSQVSPNIAFCALNYINVKLD